MTKVFQLLLVLVAFAPLAQAEEIKNGIFAGSCNEELITEFDRMMRPLKISPEFLHYLVNDDPDARLLPHLLRLYIMIESLEFTSVRKSTTIALELNSELIEGMKQTGFFTAYPQYFSLEALNTFVVLTKTPTSLTLDESTRAIASVFFKDLLKGKKPNVFINWDPTEAQLDSRLANLLDSEDSREAIATLLEIPYLLEKMTILFKEDASRGDKSLVRRLRSDRLLPRDLPFLRRFLKSYVELMSVGIPLSTHPIRIFNPDGRLEIYHMPIIAFTADFLGRVQPNFVPATLIEQVRVLDHFMFGHPLPIKLAAYRRAFVDGATLFLQPARERFRKFQENSSVAQPAPLKDFPAVAVPSRTVTPQVTNPNKRRASPIEVVEPIPLVAPSNDPAEPDLALVTGADSLKAGATYHFKKFDRQTGNFVGRQRVAFSEGVLDWFQDNPDLARAMIKSFIAGAARVQGQNGLRALKFGEVKVYKGLIYEVKIASKDRLLAVNINGRWLLLEHVTKNEVDRRARALDPTRFAIFDLN